MPHRRQRSDLIRSPQPCREDDDVAAVGTAAKVQRHLRVPADVADPCAGVAVHRNMLAAVPQEPLAAGAARQTVSRSSTRPAPHAGVARRERRTRCSRRSCADRSKSSRASAGGTRPFSGIGRRGGRPRRPMCPPVDSAVAKAWGRCGCRRSRRRRRSGRSPRRTARA